MSIKAKVGRDSARTFFAGALGSIFQILTGIVIANTLGPAGKGAYSAVQLTYSGIFAGIGGVGNALTYFLTKGKRPLRVLVPLLVKFFAVMCIALWAGLYVWGKLHGFTTSLKVLIAVMPACILVSWQPSVFISYDRIPYLNLQNIIYTVIAFIGVAISLLVFHSSINGPLVTWVLAVYYLALGLVVFSLGVVRRERHGGEPVRAKEIVDFSVRSSLTNLLNFLNSRIDSILVITLAGIASYGIYTMAVAIAELLYALSQAFATAMARSIGVYDFQRSAFITATAVRLSTIAVGAVSIAIFIFAPFLIHAVYGARFDPAALPLRILLPGLIVFSSTRIFNSFYSYQLGRPIFSLYLMAAVTIIQAAGCLILIPRLGLPGAALASTTAYVIATFGQSWYFCKLTGLSQRSLWIPSAADVSQIYVVAKGMVRAGRVHDSA